MLAVTERFPLGHMRERTLLVVLAHAGASGMLEGIVPIGLTSIVAGVGVFVQLVRRGLGERWFARASAIESTPTIYRSPPPRAPEVHRRLACPWCGRRAMSWKQKVTGFAQPCAACGAPIAPVDSLGLRCVCIGAYPIFLAVAASGVARLLVVVYVFFAVAIFVATDREPLRRG